MGVKAFLILLPIRLVYRTTALSHPPPRVEFMRLRLGQVSFSFPHRDDSSPFWLVFMTLQPV